MDFYLNILHKNKAIIYFLIFVFAFIFSSLDKFPFLYNVDDKIQTFQHSEISYKNYSNYKFISNNIENINAKCEDKAYVNCGQLFRIKSSTYLNYLYSSKILYLFDNIFFNKNYDAEEIYNKNGIDKKIYDISKKYNYSIFFSYLLIFLISIFLIFKLDKYSYFFFILFILSIVLTNHHLFNFEINRFSSNGFFHLNPKAGTITDLQPKGILGFFILFSLIFYIKSSYILLFIMLVSMIFIHWAQALLIHLYFILAIFLKEILSLFLYKKIKIKIIAVSLLIFCLSFLLFNYVYISEENLKILLFDFLRELFSLHFIETNYFRLIFYLSIFLISIIFIKFFSKNKDQFSIYFINFLILGISSLIFLEFFYLLNIFNFHNDENDISLIYTRLLGNLYFIEFAFLVVFILILVFSISNLLNKYILKKKLNKIFRYCLAILILGLVLETTIEINIRGGLIGNFENSKKLFTKFNIIYFNKIYYKLKYLPEELFFTLCGEKIVKLEKKIIQKCKKDRNYKFLKKILNTHIFLNNDVVLDAINPQYPYLYPIQLNLWYKKINEQ